MTTYYNINPKFYVSVDCIIFGFDEGELKLLLLKRNFEPAMGKWSLMGGFVQEDESVDAAAKRVLAELTGLENVYMEQVGTFGDLERDPGERGFFSPGYIPDRFCKNKTYPTVEEVFEYVNRKDAGMDDMFEPEGGYSCMSLYHGLCE